MILFSALAACSGGEPAPIERVTVTLHGNARTPVCRLSYLSLNRQIPCDQVATAMQTEFRIPTSVRVVVQPSKETRYEDVGRLIQSLHAIGYATEFPSH
jgi:hypothetical protein